MQLDDDKEGPLYAIKSTMLAELEVVQRAIKIAELLVPPPSNGLWRRNKDALDQRRKILI